MGGGASAERSCGPGVSGETCAATGDEFREERDVDRVAMDARLRRSSSVYMFASMDRLGLRGSMSLSFLMKGL